MSQKSLPPGLGRFKDGWVDFTKFFQTFLKIGQAPTKDSKAEVQVGSKMWIGPIWEDNRICIT